MSEMKKKADLGPKTKGKKKKKAQTAPKTQLSSSIQESKLSKYIVFFKLWRPQDNNSKD